MNRTRQDPNSRSASPMFAAIARTVIAHPWCTIASWLVGVAIVLALAPSLATYTTGNNQVFLPNSFESVQAQNVGNKYFSAQSGATGALVVSRQDSAPLEPGGPDEGVTARHIPRERQDPRRRFSEVRSWFGCLEPKRGNPPSRLRWPARRGPE